MQLKCCIKMAHLCTLIVEYTNDANGNFPDTGSAKSTSIQCKYKWNGLLLAFSDYVLQCLVQTTCIIQHNHTAHISSAASK